MTNSGDAAETVVRVMLTGTEITLRADGLGSEKSAGAVRSACQAAQANLRQNPNEKNHKGHPRHPGIPLTKAQYRTFQKKAKPFRLLYASHPGQRQQRTNRPGAACHRAGPSEPGF